MLKKDWCLVILSKVGIVPVPGNRKMFDPYNMTIFSFTSIYKYSDDIEEGKGPN